MQREFRADKRFVRNVDYPDRSETVQQEKVASLLR